MMLRKSDSIDFQDTNVAAARGVESGSLSVERDHHELGERTDPFALCRPRSIRRSKQRWNGWVGRVVLIEHVEAGAVYTVKVHERNGPSRAWGLSSERNNRLGRGTSSMWSSILRWWKCRLPLHI
jgi:hypothetical protein